VKGTGAFSELVEPNAIAVEVIAVGKPAYALDERAELNTLLPGSVARSDASVVDLPTLLEMVIETFDW
jgi:hypothetical protein